MHVQERFYTALSGGRPDRVPTLPKIWLDLAATIRHMELRDLIENPALASQVIIEAAMEVKADGVRLFHFPKRKTRHVNGDLFEINDQGEIFGPIDLKGGLSTQLLNADKILLEDFYQMAFLQFWTPPEPRVSTLSDVRRIAVPDKSFYQSSEIAAIEGEIISTAGDRLALLGDCGSPTLSFLILLRKMTQAMMDLLEQPRLAHAIMEKGEAIAIERGKFHIDSGIRMLRVNDSVANMSVISPQHWREFVFPHMKTVCDELHRYCPEVRIYCHICGNVMPVMEDIVKTGLDCIGPLDPLGGFTCAQARKAVGSRAALMGGVNTLSFVHSTPQQLIEEARQCIVGAGQHGGFVLGSGCALPRSSKIENLLALHQASYQYGTYISDF